MPPKLGDFFRHYLLYSAATLLGRIASIVLLPVYTRHLTPADYGYLAILDLSADVFALVVGAGFGAAAHRFHFDSQDRKHRSAVWGTSLGFLALMCIIVLAALVPLRAQIAELLLGSSVSNGPQYVQLALFGTALNILNGCAGTYWLVNKWSGRLLALGIARLVVNVTLNVFFLTVLDLGLSALLLGNLITAAFVFSCNFGGIILSLKRLSFDRSLLLGMFLFGYPVVLSSLLTQVVHQADRLILRVNVDMSDVGLYSLAYQMGQAVFFMLMFPFNRIWGVVIFDIAKRPDSSRVFAKLFEYFCYVSALVFLGPAMLGDAVIFSLTTEEYYSAAAYLPVISLGFFFFSLHAQFTVPVVLKKRTDLLLRPSGVAAVSNVVLNLILVPVWGVWAAAWVTVGTYAVLSFYGLVRYRRVKRLPYDFARVSVVVGLMVGTAGVFHIGMVGEGLFVRTVVGATLWATWAVAVGWACWRQAKILLLTSSTSNP